MWGRDGQSYEKAESSGIEEQVWCWNLPDDNYERQTFTFEMLLF